MNLNRYLFIPLSLSMWVLQPPLLSEAVSAHTGQSTFESVEVSQASGSWTFQILSNLSVQESALRMITAHISATGKDWSALRMQGDILLPGAQNTVPAALLLQGFNQGRLDVQRSSGLSAVIIEGAVRKSLDVNGRSTVDSYGAGVAALVPFHLLRSVSAMDRLVAAKVDRQQFVDGVLCDKLSVRLAPGVAKPHDGAPPQSVQIDFYFDPSTHLIRQTVVPIDVPGVPRAVLQVTSYSDYREVQGVMIPWHMSQTINGSFVWEIVATSVEAPDQIPASEFYK